MTTETPILSRLHQTTAAMEPLLARMAAQSGPLGDWALDMMSFNERCEAVTARCSMLHQCGHAEAAQKAWAEYMATKPGPMPAEE
jgi:hypothetical protein